MATVHLEGINASLRESDRADETALIKIPSGSPRPGPTSHRLYEFRVCVTARREAAASVLENGPPRRRTGQRTFVRGRVLARRESSDGDRKLVQTEPGILISA